ncbi:MAG TPA: VanZ family protein [Nitrosomonas sp.]|nr:VanZ family protein [Nitrosomonas sp.]
MAGGTEIAQLYIEGRTPLVSDFFIDAAGGVTGMILIRAFVSNQHENKATT